MLKALCTSSIYDRRDFGPSIAIMQKVFKVQIKKAIFGKLIDLAFQWSPFEIGSVSTFCVIMTGIE